jgi:hypothetical protein
MHSLLPAAIPVLLIAYLLSLPALSFQAADDPDIPLTYEELQKWFEAVNKTRKLAKGDSCMMDRNTNIDLYTDLIHPYRSMEKEKFMKHINLSTKKIVTKEQLKAYWNQTTTHCDVEHGLLCFENICRACREDVELKKENKDFRISCGDVEKKGIIQPKPAKAVVIAASVPFIIIMSSSIHLLTRSSYYYH